MDEDTLEFLSQLEHEHFPSAETNQKLVPAGERRCPICQQQMIVDAEYGFAIDVCPEHGIWLDRGELPAIVARIRSGERINRETALRHARRDGKTAGMLFGTWSLLFD